MAATTEHPMRELDRRTHDGIEVRLLWDAQDDRCVVTVHDGKADDAFTLVVGRRESPLDVFRHPFAYRALRDRPLALAA